MRPGLYSSSVTLIVGRTPGYIPEAALDDLKAPTPTQNQVTQRHSDILVDDFAVPFRSVIVTKDMHGTDNYYTRCISWDDHNTLLVIMVHVGWVALPHHKMEFCPWIPGTTDPPGKTVSDK